MAFRRVPGLFLRSHIPYGHPLAPTPNVFRETTDGVTATPLRQKPHTGENGCKLVAISPILAFRGVPRDSVAFRGFRFALISPIWPSIEPNARRIPAKQPSGRRATATPLRQKPHKRGHGCTLVAFRTISALRGVPLGSGAFAAHSFPHMAFN